MNVPPGRMVSSSVWRGTKLMSLVSQSHEVLYWDDVGIFDFFPSNGVRVLFISEADMLSDDSSSRYRLVKSCRVDTTLRKVVLLQHTSLTTEKYSQFQKFAAIDLGLSVIPVNTIEEVSQILKQMVNCEGRKDANPFRKKPCVVNNPDEAILKTLRIVPGLGENKAFKAIERFGSLQHIINASKTDLSEVIELGAAAKVHSFFCEKI